MFEPRKRGRPPKLRECTTCNTKKPSLAFKGPTYTACIACESGVRPSTQADPGLRTDRAYMAEIRNQNPIPVHAPIQACMTDVITMEATKKALTSIITPLQRCECCWETRHVRRDAYGQTAFLCARCEYQVQHRGCCRLHNSSLFYPELAEGKPTQPADEPLEVTMLFASGTVARPPAVDPEAPPVPEPDL